MGRALVFWIPESLIPLLHNQAPDFWDYHSGLYEFDAPETERKIIFQSLSETEPRWFDGLKVDKLEDYLILYRELLDEYAGKTRFHRQVRLDLYFKLASLYSLLAQYEAARATIQQALREINSDNSVHQQPDFLIMLGNIQQTQGSFDEARRSYEKALQNFESLSDESGKALVYNGLGNLYYKKADYHQAIGYYEKALAIDQTAYGKRHPDVARDLNNLGLLLRAGAGD